MIKKGINLDPGGHRGLGVLKLSHTKIAVAVMAIFASSATLATGINFSNLSVGTVTALTISQTGEGRSRISDGAGLTSAQGVVVGDTAARGVSFERAADATGAFVQSGALTTLSLTQTNSATSEGDKENAITGSMYTTGSGSVTVNQDGKGNVVDFAIGTSSVAVATPTVSIIQKGDNNQTELTRTAGSNTDTIASYGDSNTVKVTGSATGTNSVSLTFGSSGAATSSSNQATVSQTGSANAFTAQVTGSSNILDVGQSATTAATISIIGSTNNVDVTQSGAAGTATLALTGSGNTVGIQQLAASNTAFITLAATSATMNIIQQTVGATYTYAGTIPSGGSINVTQ